MDVFKKVFFGGWKDIAFRFFRIFLPLAIFFGSLTVLFYYKDVQTELLSVKKAEYYKISSQVEAINSKFESIITDLQFLTLQSELLEYLEDSNSLRFASLTKELELFASMGCQFGGLK